MTTITIANGTVTVGASVYPSLNYVAEYYGELVTIHHKDVTKDVICQGNYDTLDLIGLGVPVSAPAFVVAFNAAVAVTTVADATGAEDIVARFNELLGVLRSKEVIDT